MRACRGPRPRWLLSNLSCDDQVKGNTLNGRNEIRNHAPTTTTPDTQEVTRYGRLRTPQTQAALHQLPMSVCEEHVEKKKEKKEITRE